MAPAIRIIAVLSADTPEVIADDGTHQSDHCNRRNHRDKGDHAEAGLEKGKKFVIAGYRHWHPVILSRKRLPSLGL
jgi:hypothetical protein